MPRGRPSADAESIRASVFSSLAHRIRAFRGEVYPFHVGDTWLDPPAGCRLQDLAEGSDPGLHRYAPPSGLPRLVEALVERTRRRTGLDVDAARIQITAGATGGLSAAMAALVEPGEEVLVLAPYWPLIEGIVRAHRGRPVAVPFLGTVDDRESAVEQVERHRSERTVALYLGSPNNPTGKLIPTRWIEALVEWARRHDLWVISDEVYDELVFAGDAPSVVPLAPERVISAHSFSKSWAMAGNRCGWVVGPPSLMPAVARTATHDFYSTPTASQLLAARLLESDHSAWLVDARERYRQLGELAARRLGVDPPQGSTFLFVDVADRLDERGLLGFLEDCADRGLFLAPGPSFGPYPTSVRVCYTAAPPEVTERGLGVMAELIGRG